MSYKGKGCLKRIVVEWNKLFIAAENCVVIQRQSMSGIASMRISNGKWEIELGQ